MCGSKGSSNRQRMFFGEDEILVSKTNARGIITYANDVFRTVSGYREEDLLGQPHNLIRHPAINGHQQRIALADQLEQSAKNIAEAVSRSALQIRENAREFADTSEKTTADASTVAEGGELTSQSVQNRLFLASIGDEQRQ